MRVANFEEDPLIWLARTADEHPFAFKLLPLQHEVKLAFLPSGFRSFRIDHFIGSVVPDNDVAGAVVAFGNDSFESAVVERMIFGEYRETLFTGIEGGTFGNRPGSQHAFHFETEVIMESSGAVFLNNESVAASLLEATFRLRGFIEAALTLVLFKTHV